MAVTYDQLVQETPLGLYAQNRDIVAEMPRLIAKAEDRIFELIDHDLFQTVLTGKTLLAGDPEIDLTSDGVREVRAIRLAYRGDNQWTSLLRRDLEFLTMLYTVNRPGRPLYYAEYSAIDILRVFPVPREDYQLEVTANVFPERLGPTNQTNILSQRFPQVYEQAVLLRGAIFMKSPKDVATFTDGLNEAVLAANTSIARRRRDQTGTRETETANMAGM